MTLTRSLASQRRSSESIISLRSRRFYRCCARCVRENPGVRSYNQWASALNRSTKRGSVTRSNRWSRRRRRTASPTMESRNSAIDDAGSAVSSNSASLSKEWAPAWTPPAGEVTQPGVCAADRVDALNSARGAARGGADGASGMAAEEAVSAIWSRRRRSSPSSCCISAMSNCDSVVSATGSGRRPPARRDPRVALPRRPAAHAENVSSASVVSNSVVFASARRRAADAGDRRVARASRRLGGAKTPLRRAMSRGVFAGPPGPHWDVIPVSPWSESTARSVAAGCAWLGSKSDVPSTVATELPPAVDAAGPPRPRERRSGKDGSPPLPSGRAPATAAKSPSLTTARGAPPAREEEEEEEATRSMAPRAAARALRRSYSGPVQPRDRGRGSCNRAWDQTGVTQSAKCSTTP